MTMLLRRLSNFKGLLFLIGLLLVWEVIGRAEIVQPPVFFPPLSSILVTLLEHIVTLEIPRHAGLTLLRSLSGLAAAAVIAIPLGIFMGHFRKIHDLLGVTVEALRPIPPAAVIPVAIVFLGIHDKMKFAVITFGCLWPILLNTIQGVRSIDPVLIETARTLKVRGAKFFWEIIVKAASPYIVTGVRISLAIAMILAIVTEMIAGNSGLGFFILISERSFQFKEMYAGIIAIALTGYLLNQVFVLVVDRFLMRWYRGYTAKI